MDRCNKRGRTSFNCPPFRTANLEATQDHLSKKDKAIA